MKNINKVISLSLAIVLLANPFNAFALTKTETIYSTLGVSGNVKKTTINTKLTDISKGDIEDYTYLENIKNLNGHEKFTRDGEKLTWKSTGKDIFYSGKYNDELPVKVNIKYYLDGEEVKPRDIKGKSGTITMKINFTNNSFDSKSGMYTPFVVSTTMLIDGENNSNISISTGKVVSTGTKNVVTGISAPGLYESTNLSNFKDLDTLTISYKTTDFSTNEIYFVITPKLLSEVDLSTLDKVDSLNSSLNLLQDSMNQLESGANKLNDGTASLKDGVNKLNSGTKSARDGSKKLNDGVSSLNSGIKQSLDGAKALADGTGKVDTNLQTIIAGIKEQENNLTAKSSAMQEQFKKVTELQQNNQATIDKLTTGNQQIEAGVNAQVSKYDLDITSNDFSTKLEYAHSKALIDDNTYKTYKASYDNNVGLITLLTDNNDSINTMVGSLESSLSEINTALTTLDGYLSRLQNEGTSMTKSGAQSLYAGLSKIYAGSTTLNSGTESLTSGLEALYSGTQTLVGGTNELSSGTSELANGISKINSEGINQLANYGEKAVNYKNKLKTLTNLSKNYKGFASDNADTTIFVYKIAK
jgi:putative membrane protein